MHSRGGRTQLNESAGSAARTDHGCAYGSHHTPTSGTPHVQRQAPRNRRCVPRGHRRPAGPCHRGDRGSRDRGGRRSHAPDPEDHQSAFPLEAQGVVWMAVALHRTPGLQPTIDQCDTERGRQPHHREGQVPRVDQVGNRQHPSEDCEMSDEVERGRGRVPVQYHQFDISDEDGTTGPDLDRGHNALVRVDKGVTIVMTGIHTGDVDVDVTVTVHETEPAPDDGNWQLRKSPPATTGCAFTPAAGTPPPTWPSTRSPSGTSSRPDRHPPNRARCSVSPRCRSTGFRSARIP